MLPLETERLIIRPFEEADRALFHEINSDEKVMEHYPYRRTRAQSMKCSTRGAYGLRKPATATPPLKSGRRANASVTVIWPYRSLSHSCPQARSRLAGGYWGNGYTTEAGKALRADGFTRRWLNEIFSFAVPANRRLLAVINRIGTVRDFDHPKIVPEHAHLRRHVVYSLTKESWESAQR